jgi:hypothetical protein
MEAVIKEVNGHINNNHWMLIPHTEVPEGTEVVPSVWAMQCKQGLTTGRVTKHKARLNLHGGMKNYARRYLSYLPISHVLAKRVEHIKDTFGRAHHWKLARRAGRTLCTLCSSVSRLHA